MPLQIDPMDRGAASRLWGPAGRPLGRHSRYGVRSVLRSAQGCGPGFGAVWSGPYGAGCHGSSRVKASHAPKSGQAPIPLRDHIGGCFSARWLRPTSRLGFNVGCRRNQLCVRNAHSHSHHRSFDSGASRQGMRGDLPTLLHGCRGLQGVRWPINPRRRAKPIGDRYRDLDSAGFWCLGDSRIRKREPRRRLRLLARLGLAQRIDMVAPARGARSRNCNGSLARRHRLRL